MKRYWERSCAGRAWLKEFPTAQSDEVRSFLVLFVGSFGFPRKRALQFAPNDRLLDIYRALYWGGPVSTDGLELGISISDLFSSSSLLIRAPRGFPAARSAAQAAEGSE